MDRSHLFEKVILNNEAEVPNHLAIAPLTLFSSNPDGTINDEEREYLKLRATNIGLYIIGAQVVSKEGITAINFPGTYCDKDIPSIEERAKIIKSQGALAINQIHYGGALALKQYSGREKIFFCPRRVPIASPVPGTRPRHITSSKKKFFYLIIF